MKEQDIQKMQIEKSSKLCHELIDLFLDKVVEFHTNYDKAIFFTVLGGFYRMMNSAFFELHKQYDYSEEEINEIIKKITSPEMRMKTGVKIGVVKE